MLSVDRLGCEREGLRRFAQSILSLASARVTLTYYLSPPTSPVFNAAMTNSIYYDYNLLTRRSKALLRKKFIDVFFSHGGTKVFAIGFNKTGTSSLHKLFLDLGLTSFHGPAWSSLEDKFLLRSYHCFSDAAPRNFDKIEEDYPQAKFILNVRDLGDWLISRIRHIERYKNAGKHIPSAGWDITYEAISSWLFQRNEHHLKVQEYFKDRPHDLLVINFIRDKNGASKVANFLGFEGYFVKPEENVAPIDEPILSDSKDLLDSVLNDLSISTDDLRRDILCTSILEKKLVGGYAMDTGDLR